MVVLLSLCEVCEASWKRWEEVHFSSQQSLLNVYGGNSQRSSSCSSYAPCQRDSSLQILVSHQTRIPQVVVSAAAGHHKYPSPGPARFSVRPTLACTKNLIVVVASLSLHGCCFPYIHRIRYARITSLDQRLSGKKEQGADSSARSVDREKTRGGIQKQINNTILSPFP
jgi:hypothetical protein